MNITPRRYKLSYMVNTVVWDGKYINNLPMDKICADLDVMKECGIDEVMISGYHDEEPATFDMYEETKRLGAEMEKRGMHPNQHHGVAATFAPVGSSQQKVIDMLKHQIDYTANMRAETLIFHTGRVEGHYSGIQEADKVYLEQLQKHGLSAVLDTVAQNLSVCADYAEKCGVKIAIENNCDPMSSLSMLPELIRRANHRNLGYCLDAGHAHCNGISPMQWIEIMSMEDKLFITNFHDNRGTVCKVMPGFPLTANNDEHLPPGFGTIPWIDVIISLWKNNYSRTVNFESAPWPHPDRRKGLEYAINFWRNCEHFAEIKLAKMMKK